MKRTIYIVGMAVLACNPLGTIVVLCLLIVWCLHSKKVNNQNERDI